MPFLLNHVALSNALSPEQAACLFDVLTKDSRPRIAKTLDVRTLDVLAGRPDLEPTLANRIAARNDRPTPRKYAFRRVADPELLAKGMTFKTLRPSIAQNPFVAPEKLAEFLESDPDTEVRLRAACNPNTPLEVRRQVLADPFVVAGITWISTPLGARVVRNHELALANRWMLEHPKIYQPDMVRALMALPEAGGVFLKELAKDGRRRCNWTSLRNHPTLAGQNLASMSAKELAAAGSAAADVALLERPETTAKEASRLLDAELRAAAHPEPHVLGMLVRRFLSEPVRELERPPVGMGSTRHYTAIWSEPCAADVLWTDRNMLEELHLWLPSVPADRATWQTLLTLSNEWTGSIEDLFRAVTSL